MGEYSKKRGRPPEGEIRQEYLDRPVSEPEKQRIDFHVGQIDQHWMGRTKSSIAVLEAIFRQSPQHAQEIYERLALRLDKEADHIGRNIIAAMVYLDRQQSDGTDLTLDIFLNSRLFFFPEEGQLEKARLFNSSASLAAVDPQSIIRFGIIRAIVNGISELSATDVPAKVLSEAIDNLANATVGVQCTREELLTSLNRRRLFVARELNRLSKINDDSSEKMGEQFEGIRRAYSSLANNCPFRNPMEWRRELYGSLIRAADAAENKVADEVSSEVGFTFRQIELGLCGKETEIEQYLRDAIDDKAIDSESLAKRCVVYASFATTERQTIYPARDFFIRQFENESDPTRQKAFALGLQFLSEQSDYLIFEIRDPSVIGLLTREIQDREDRRIQANLLCLALSEPSNLKDIKDIWDLALVRYGEFDKEEKGHVKQEFNRLTRYRTGHSFDVIIGIIEGALNSPQGESRFEALLDILDKSIIHHFSTEQRDLIASNMAFLKKGASFFPLGGDSVFNSLESVISMIRPALRRGGSGGGRTGRVRRIVTGPSIEGPGRWN